MAEKRNQSKRSRKTSQRDRGESIHEVADPEARIDELHKELFQLRFQLATRQLTNTSRIREVRRDIARYRTVLRQRALATAVSQASA